MRLARDDTKAATPAELGRRIEIRELELDRAERRMTEELEAIGGIADHARRTAAKANAVQLGQQVAEIRLIVERLRHAQRQAITNEKLVARGGVIVTPVWAADPFKHREGF